MTRERQHGGQAFAATCSPGVAQLAAGGTCGARHEATCFTSECHRLEPAVEGTPLA